MTDQDRERWTKLVADFEGSDLTQREFAWERGISFCNLRIWLYRLRKESRRLSCRWSDAQRESVALDARARRGWARRRRGASARRAGTRSRVMEADAARRRHLEQRRECVGRQLLADDLVFVFDAAGWHTALGASEARDLVAYIAASRGRFLPTSPSNIDLLLK